MRAFAVALASLALLDGLLAFGGRTIHRVVASGAAVTFALCGALLVGYAPLTGLALAATVAAEAPLWVAARRGGKAAPLLGALSAALAVRMGTAGLWGGTGESVLDRWVETAAFDVVLRSDPDRVAYVVAAAAFLAAAGNTYVRLLLGSMGSLSNEDGRTPGGGRVIGSIERVLIFALGVAGQLTAATLIVPAKGILRFAEVRATPDDDIDRVTEYVLVGSLASYALALAFVVLA